MTDKKASSNKLESIVLGLGNMFLLFLKTLANFIHSPITKMKEFWIFGSLLIGMLSYRIVYENDHLMTLYERTNGLFGYRSIELFEGFAWGYHFTFMNLLLWGVTLFVIGLVCQVTRQKYAKLTQNLAIRSKSGQYPKLQSIEHFNNGNRTSLKYAANGVGLDDFRSKESQIALFLKRKIETIGEDIRNGLIEVVLNNAELPKVVRFEDVKKFLKEPYSFIVGQCENKLHKQSIRKLPHMLVAGTTSNGKSNFLKNVILGMLGSSEKIRLHIIDLKRGVEMQKFKNFNNIEIAANEREANQMLKDLVNEMNARYEFMKKENINEIDPKKHKKDVRVLIVDEASVLYDFTGLQRAQKMAIQESRNFTDTLTKLARAAGIHVIIATQKVTKETVDSRIQGNMGGWMCFKVATDIASRLVLETGAASKLPKIAGRGIWKVGNEFAEVQSPLVDDKCLESEIENLEEKFNKLYPKKLVTNPSGRDDNNE